MNQRIAIDFGRRGKKEPRPLRLGKPKCFVRTERAYFQGLDRQLQIIDRAGGGSEVENEVDRSVNEQVVRYVILDELEPGIPGEMGDVGRGPRDEIVDAGDGVAFGDQTITQMRAEESRPTRDYGSCHMLL